MNDQSSGTHRLFAIGKISRVLAVLLGVVVLAISVFSVVSSPKAASMVYAENPGMTPPPRVEYYLPYPGILPDNPLYKLKAIRDQVKLWTTFDPIQKAEVQLFFSDKRINAALALIEGGKKGLAVTTATKAEKYLEQSVTTAVTLRQAGKDTKSLLLKQAKAVAKHGEILQTLKRLAEGADQPVLEQTAKVNQLLSQQIAQALIAN